MPINKDTVISNLNQELLKERKLRIGLEKQHGNLHTTLEKVEKKAEKYREWYKLRSRALKSALADRAEFARKLTILEGKKIPKGILSKLKFLIKNQW